MMDSIDQGDEWAHAVYVAAAAINELAAAAAFGK